MQVDKKRNDIMILVIDGYNVLKHRSASTLVDERERQHFLRTLSLYGKKRGHTIVVVFDGGLYEWPHKETIDNGMVIYAGNKKSADEVIMDYLEIHKTKDILLVSSDHELNLFASRQGIVSLGAADFYYFLQEAIEEPSNTSQSRSIRFDESSTDLEAIMEQAAEYISVKEEDRMPRRTTLLLSRVSKKDKILLKKLKKL